MIISVHIFKTAGTSFAQCLGAKFGNRLLVDTGDWVAFTAPEAIAHRAARAAQMRARRDELLEHFDVIHGHFIADKYLDLFPQTDFVAFFRDPYQQTISHYLHLLRHPEDMNHPVTRTFHEAKMTIFDFLSWRDFGNPQASFLGSLSIESLAMAGLTEEFTRSVALFNRTFGHDISSNIVTNVNPERQGQEYEIDADLRRAIERFRDKDLDLYRRAKEAFAKHCRCRAV